jgi:hypothetical protein
MANLIYPLATIIPLALGGAVFMVVYLRVYRETKFRRSAVLASAIVHRVYNRLAIIAFVASLALIFGSMLLVHIGIGVGTLAVMVFGTRFADYITSRQQIVEPVMD